MICILCLENSIDCINIFNEEGGFSVDSIISKHFWLKPKENDAEYKNICYKCWHITKSFHVFHTKIELAHKNLTNNARKVDPLNVNENLIKIELEDNSRNDSIVSLSPSNFVNIFKLPTEDGDYTTRKDEQPSIITNAKRRTRKSVKYSESPEKELIEPVESITTTTDPKCITEPTSITSPTPIVLQTETNLKNEADPDDPDAHELDDDTEEVKLARRRNVLRNPDKVDEKISIFMQLICDLCQTICPTLAALKAHFRTVHEIKGYAICCKKKFFKRYLLIDHIDTHINPEHFKCTECDKIFAVADCLKRHVQELHKAEKCFYYCDKCPKKFVREMLLERHKAHHNPIETWTFTCDDCGKVFPSKFYLKSHRTFSHNNLPSKICHICGKAVQSNRYKTHIMEHDGITEPKIQCEICGAWLKKKYMGTHKINHREAEVIHSCTTCGKISPNRRALYIHMRYTHAENRNHECTVCSKTFKRRLALKQHMATHTGDNLYKCPYCQKSFTYDSNFHNHKKKEHPKEYEEERKRNRRTDFVKCTQKNLDNSKIELNEQYDSLE